ncbi:sensor histidine kinase [Kouleothrix sp.]|uniref:sensor histidine kinase n=1 Tax=Kouleothrix sp. TaxID=2779161 RepID=UPI00391A97CB
MPSHVAVPGPGDAWSLGALLDALAAAGDWPACCAELRRALPQLIPAMRLDIYASRSESAISRVFSTDAASRSAGRLNGSEPALRAWYRRRGYQPLLARLSAAGEHYGWLALACRSEPPGAGALGLARQIAPLLALRLRDECARHELERQAERAMLIDQRLRATDTLLVQAVLAAGTAHDLGNLFTSVLANAQLLLQDVPEALRRDVSTIVRAAEDGRHLLQRLQTGLVQPESSAALLADLPSVIEEAIRLTRPIWQNKRGVTLVTQLREVAPARIRAPDLREVLINLIINASSMLNTTGQITIACAPREREVLISVTDTGPGIAPEQQKLIFQPMATTRAHGSGLGLSISRALLEFYGGALTVESAPGQGATFSVILPAAERDRVVAGAHEPLLPNVVE